MNKFQLEQITLLKSESEAPELIPEQLEEIQQANACNYYLKHDCKECNACCIYEVLNDPDAYII